MDDLDAIIIGAGFSGLLSGIKLRLKGINNFKILEQAPDLGGTWYWNRYPGVACDIPSLSYLPLAHLPGYAPTHLYSSGESILQFMKQLCEYHGLNPRIHLNTKAISATFVQRSERWKIKTSDGYEYACKYLVFGKGPLSVPNDLEFPGLSKYTGQSCRTSSWDTSQVQVENKIVGVVGTGASAVQVIPELANVAKHVYVFQRSPVYCFPRHNGPVSESIRDAIKAKGAPYIERFRVENNAYVDFEIHDLYHDEKGRNRVLQRTAQIIRSKVKDPIVAEKLIPDYPLGCKRVCITDDYWDVFNRHNVTLIADSGGVKGAFERGLVTYANRKVECDCVVWATGFDAVEGYFSDMEVNGIGGQTLTESWKSENGGVHSLFGMMVNGFPNMFILLGPQGFNGHANACEIIEIQTDWVAHIIDCINKMSVPNHVSLVQPIKRYENDWVEKCRKLASVSVWSKCSNWYNGNGKGVATYTGKWYEYVKALCDETHYSLEVVGKHKDDSMIFGCLRFDVTLAQLPKHLRSGSRL